MPSVEDTAALLVQTPHTPDTLTTGDFDLSPSATGDASTVAELQAKRLMTLREDSFDLDLVAYESFPSDSTTGDTDTFDLSHYPITTDSVAEDVVVYAGSEKVASSDFSVDFDANTLDYSGDETVDDLHVFYASAQQTRYEVRKVAPNGTSEKIDEGDLSLVLRQNSNTDPLTIEYDHPLQGVVPAYWKLQIRVDGPYTVRWSVDAAGGEATADQMLAHLPINRASQEVPDWVSSVVGAVAGAQ